MFAVTTCLHHHDPALVSWAAIICLVAAVTGLFAYRRAITTRGAHRAAWIATVAVVLGAGVWATHFMAMLAYHREMQIGFGPKLTAVSLLLAVGGIGLGAGVAVSKHDLAHRLAGGAICGAAIALMHFVGVAGMRVPAGLAWDPGLRSLAIAIAVIGSASAFAVAAELTRIWRFIAAVLLLVVAICGLHFVAMSAVTLVPSANPFDPGPYGRTELSFAVVMFATLITLAGGALFGVDRISSAATFAGLRAALDGAPSAMAVFDADARLAIWNQSYADLCGGWSVRLRRGLSFEAIIRAVGETGLDGDAMETALAHGGAKARVTLDAFEGPGERWFQPQMGPTSDGGFVVLITDITTHLEVTRREVAAREAAEAANQAKSDFIANVSHEIRTPLNGVLGMAQVMAGDALTPPQRDRLDIINQSGGELLTVVDRILDLYKVETGRLELEERTFDLQSWLETATAPFAAMAAQKHLAFELDCDASALGAWSGDTAKIGQVLANLLSNAVKFTEQGGVKIQVLGSPDGLVFEVADTGVGIPPEKQEMIFETFTQADSSTTRRFGGTGLGLALCRRYAAFLGATLCVDSLEAEGTTFSFSVPLQRIAAAAPSPEASADQSDRLRVLAAEDNPTNQLILQALLEPLDVDLTLVANGREAVEAWRRSGFDLILMDIQMPQMDGVEATRAIRKAEGADGLPRTPIIAVTANVLREQVESYLAAGMDAAVPKPINFSSLVSAMEAALSGPGPGSETRAEAA